MTKIGYLNRLRACLSTLPATERDFAITYYEELFEDAGTKNEQELIAELGDVRVLASGILSDQPFVYAEKSAEFPPMTEKPEDKSSKESSNKAAETPCCNNTKLLFCIIILSLTFPIWFPVCLGIICGILGLGIGFGAAFLVLFLGGLVLIGIGIGNLIQSVPLGLTFLGVGFLILGIGLLLFIPLKLLIGNTIPCFIRWLRKILTELICGKSRFETAEGVK